MQVIFISLQHFIAPALGLLPCLQAQGTRDCNFCLKVIFVLLVGKYSVFGWNTFSKIVALIGLLYKRAEIDLRLKNVFLRLIKAVLSNYEYDVYACSISTKINAKAFQVSRYYITWTWKREKCRERNIKNSVDQQSFTLLVFSMLKVTSKNKQKLQFSSKWCLFLNYQMKWHFFKIGCWALLP